MQIIKITLQDPKQQIIKRVADVIRNGEILVYPTDTCYGLGVDPENKKAVLNLAKLKGRPRNKKFSVVMRDLKMIKDYCIVGARQEKILKKYLPGPFTFILKEKTGDETLGVRIPDCIFTQKLSNELQIPYTATSANLSGAGECYEIDCVLKQFKKSEIKPDLILDGGELKQNPPSTVVDLTQSQSKILRQGRGQILPSHS